MDLEASGAAVLGGLAMPGLLARLGPPRRRGQGGVRVGRRGRGSVRSRPEAAAGGRLLGRGRVGRGVGSEDAGRRRWGGVGCSAELFRGPPDAIELCAAAASWAVDWQRAGGGVDQAVTERE